MSSNVHRGIGMKHRVLKQVLLCTFYVSLVTCLSVCLSVGHISADQFPQSVRPRGDIVLRAADS